MDRDESSQAPTICRARSAEVAGAPCSQTGRRQGGIWSGGDDQARPMKTEGLHSFRKVFVGSPRSLGERQRAKRWDLLRATFPEFEEMRILDLGGTALSWMHAPCRPASVTVINLSRELINLDLERGRTEPTSTLRMVVGDATEASKALRDVGIEPEFDLVYSNSVFEHVGGHASRAKMAAEIQKLAPRYWVQTPYRYFPVEPHWLFPGMQFMPVALRNEIAQRWPLAPFKAERSTEMLAEILNTELLSATEMHFYFPDAQLLKEKFLGITKSLIATR